MYLARITINIFFTIFLLFSLGCATQPTSIGHVNSDPYEPINRKVFKFNATIDKYTLKPVAKIYKKVVPKSISKGVANVFSNVDDATNIVQDVLQGRFEWALEDLSRVLVNSTLGLGGIFDVTDDLNMDLPKRTQDTGVTLARWGVAQGPYLMLPLLGPSTLRDTVGMIPDRAINPISNPYNAIEDVATSISLGAVQVVDLRAGLLDVEKFLMGDQYIMLRETYLSQRHFVITGEVLEKEDDFLSDDFSDDEDYDDDW